MLAGDNYGSRLKLSSQYREVVVPKPSVAASADKSHISLSTATRSRRRGELDLPKCVGATPLGLTPHLVGVPRVEATLGFGTKPLRGNKTENLDCLDCLDWP